jgi:hypothetical protein
MRYGPYRCSGRSTRNGGRPPNQECFAAPPDGDGNLLTTVFTWTRGVSRHWGSKRYWALPATSSELKCLDICWSSTKRAPAIPPISGHSPAITAAGARAQADAATIARLEKLLEQASSRAYQAEQDRHQAEAHADRAEQRAEGADLAWEAENKRADQAEQARDLLQAAFDQARTDAQARLTQLEQLRARADQAEAGRDGERTRADDLADRVHVLQSAFDGLQTEAEARLEQIRTDAQAADQRAEASEPRRG